MKSSWQERSHHFAFGPFIKCPHPEIIEVCKFSGCDFAVIDMEHSALSPPSLYPLVLAAEARSIDLIVRIPNSDESYLKWVLDLGIRFIQIPHIQCSKDVEKVMDAAYFKPKGSRGLCRFVRASNFSAIPGSSYIETASEKTHLIFQIEGKKGLDSFADIINVPGLEYIFIGPYDLSQSLGRPGDIWHHEVTSRMHEVLRLSKEKKIKVGTFTDSVQGVKKWAEAGMDIIQYASDLNILMSGIQQIRKELSAD